MKIRFDQRVAIVTGAGAGLGRRYALELAARGARVVVNDPGELPEGGFRALAVVDEIRRLGGAALPNYDNVADREAAARIAAETMAHFGRVDILINNAGILRDKSFLKMTLDDFEEVLRVHLLGSVYLTKSVFPIMRDANYGRILLTTSTAGLYGNFGQTNYAAAKLGLIGFMHALKLEGAKYDIAVNAIAPIAATGMAGGTFPEAVADRITPELVAAMVLYLVSDQCGATGKILSAGGGYYSSIQISEGSGVRFDAGAVSAEQIAERFPEIVSMKGAKRYENATENVLQILAPLLKSEK